MSQINSIANSLTGNKSAASAINDVNIDDFLNLMIAELQNQDPLNPMENDELIQQISQIREVGATEKLTETLDSVLLGQNIASATNLIGAEIDAISDDNERVTGSVKRVAIADGVPKLHLEEASGAVVSDKPGDLAEGEYRYRIVWEATDGTLLGIETNKPIEVDADGKSVLLANLPETGKAKQIYRTKVGSEGPFFLVGTLNSGKTGSFLDTTADEDLSGAVLNRTPRFVLNAARQYEVSLSNVGEIRPPAKPATTTSPTTSTSSSNDTTGTTEGTDET
jgi:flagellar basal-body rod modification protein FlgD